MLRRPLRTCPGGPDGEADEFFERRFNTRGDTLSETRKRDSDGDHIAETTTTTENTNDAEGQLDSSRSTISSPDSNSISTRRFERDQQGRVILSVGSIDVDADGDVDEIETSQNAFDARGNEILRRTIRDLDGDGQPGDSCTYDGMRYDLAPIIERAHAYDMKVIIDEAWYAHAAFHQGLDGLR